jgi:HD-GYP domain-containing protein (c-di-GMP phosphodiesterase class II)
MTGVTLLIPPDRMDLVRQSQAAMAREIVVQSYGKLSLADVARLEDEPAILVATLAEYARLGNPMLNNGGQMPTGRILLLATEADLKNVPAANLRLFDVCDPGIAPAGFAFKVNRLVADIHYDSEVRVMRAEDEDRRKTVDSLNEIGSALSSEKDLDKLLDLIVLKCRAMTRADGGTLYLVEADPNVPEDDNNYFANKKMRFQVAQNDSRNIPFRTYVMDISKKSINGYVALTQESLNFDDAYTLGTDREYSWGGREFDGVIKYRTTSMLTVPMVNWRGETIGVIQLVNRKTDPRIKLGEPETFAKHVRPFSEHDARMARSIASQASIAIQNARLVNSIRMLFDGFIAASVKAIESRDPTTSGHSQRVATLTVALAEKIDQSELPRFKDIHFTREQIQEVRYASLLHDFGKIGVREHVLVKAKKLYPDEMLHLISRFDLIRATTTLQLTRKQNELLLAAPAKTQDADMQAYQTELEEELKRINEFMAFIEKCNEPTVLAQGGFERLNEIAKHAFFKMDGTKVGFLTEKELESLSVPKGSLNENDRKEIESHVTHTYKFLSTIPWTPDLRRVPEIAYGHHEKLDGTGYPNRLNADQIPIQTKMMTISDIFDALTALDRPYKKALPHDRALNILLEEAKAQHVDAELLDVFIKSEVHKLV